MHCVTYTASQVVRTAELAKLWQAADLDSSYLEQATLLDDGVGLPSSFRVSDAAQISIASAGLAACALYHHRTGQQQKLSVARRDAEMECTGFFKLNDKTPNPWDEFSGLYPTGDGWVRLHTNFEHHREGALSLLGLGSAAETERTDVANALLDWSAQDFEDQAAELGLVVAKVRSFAEWDQHPHAQATAQEPLLSIKQIGPADPRPLPAARPRERPLTDIRVLDLTRILAGPVCGRTLAAYGADVMLVNSPTLPNIAAIIDTSRGKRSVHLDLHRPNDRIELERLVADSHIFVQGYRPGGLRELGFSSAELAAQRPGIVCVNLSAYGQSGPWGGRRGFDSLVQTATGFNHAEAEAYATSADTSDPTPKPPAKALPVQILDYASGFFMAFGAQAALLKQAQMGGSWQVDVSLLQTANWLRSLGQSNQHINAQLKGLSAQLQRFPCSEGELLAMPHAASLSLTPPTWVRAASLPGHDPASW